MGHYFYLAASLPALHFAEQPSVSSEALRDSLKQNLSKSDAKKLAALRLYIDISNLRPLLQEQDIDPRGNLGEKELDEAILDRNILPQYVFDFLEKNETLAEKLQYFSVLLAQFYREEVGKHTGFLKRLFVFEREWRLIVLALRAKSLGRNIVEELQFEDSTDPFVMQILVQKDAPQYEPPEEYREIKELLQACGTDPLKQSRAISLYRFNKIEEMNEATQFSMDWILAYIVRLTILEHWNELDQAKGKIILDTFKTS
jgi:hypothetical protein